MGREAEKERERELLNYSKATAVVIFDLSALIAGCNLLQNSLETFECTEFSKEFQINLTKKNNFDILQELVYLKQLGMRRTILNI